MLSNVTAVASVSAKRGLVYLKLQYKGVSDDNFPDYIRELSKKMNYERFYLYMDNYCVHDTNKATNVYKAMKITRVNNISYAPDLNPIEACFSHVKRLFNKARLNAIANEEEFDMEKNIKKAFKVITPKLVTNCAKRSLSLLKNS
jgi:transposase